MQEGANRYAEQVLSELETRLGELNKVVHAGRRELGRLQTGETLTASDRAGAPATDEPETKDAALSSRARRAASRLRQVAGRG